MNFANVVLELLRCLADDHGVVHINYRNLLFETGQNYVLWTVEYAKSTSNTSGLAYEAI